MSKLSALLLSNGNLTKTSESGSEYYSIVGKAVRVSDHLAPVIVIETLNIIIPQQTKKQYIVIFMGHFYIHNSFTSLRVFLENWVMISKEYTKRLNCLENATIKALNKKLSESETQIRQLQLQIISRVNTPFQVNPTNLLNIKDLTIKQKHALLQGKSINTPEQIQAFRETNEINRLRKLNKKRK